VQPRESVARPRLSTVLFLTAMLAAMGLVLAASVAIMRTRALPRILGLSGFPIAASLAAAWYYLPVFALLAWLAAASLLLLFARGSAPRSARAS
jgi:hypothetical protein